MNVRKKVEVTPEVEEWRSRCPIRVWLDAEPDKKSARIKKVCDRLGLTKSALYNWMWGKALPTTDKFLAVCKMVGASPSAYMKWYRDYPPDAEAKRCVTAIDGDEDSD